MAPWKWKWPHDFFLRCRSRNEVFFRKSKEKKGLQSRETLFSFNLVFFFVLSSPGKEASEAKKKNNEIFHFNTIGNIFVNAFLLRIRIQFRGLCSLYYIILG